VNISIPLPIRPNQRVLVVGMGMSGLKTAEALTAAGARVTVTDDRKKDVSGYLFVAPSSVNLEDFDLICLSPGIAHKSPRPHPIVQKAYAAGIPLTSDIDLFFQATPQAFTIGVTGTNGKSSTVSLIHHTLCALGTRAELGGNIGVPILSLPWLDADETYVIELSSYQLETAPHLALDLAILLAITPDHLDRYDTMEAYAEAKFNIFKGAKQCLYDVTDTRQKAFVNLQNDQTRFIPYHPYARIGGGFSLVKSTLYNDYCGASEQFIVKDTHIPAPTLLCAFAALSLKGFDGGSILEATQTWPGLAHRYERVLGASEEPCIWINDSKATNVEATAFAFQQSKEAPLFWIAGGRLKEHTNFDRLTPHLSHIVHAFLIGEGQDALAHFLDTQNVPFSLCGDLDTAVSYVRQALHAAPRPKTGKLPIVLLSPAAASFDQYTHFEARGNHFKALVSGDKGIKTS
jgi:UDP-N-acetylmuramoylalanine--D-glutamate ligase